MPDPINLRAARKRAKRQQAEQRAAENRVVHGQPKQVRELADARRAKADADLEAHRIEKGDGR